MLRPRLASRGLSWMRSAGWFALPSMLIHIAARSKAMTLRESMAAVERSPPNSTDSPRPFPSRKTRPVASGPISPRRNGSVADGKVPSGGSDRAHHGPLRTVDHDLGADHPLGNAATIFSRCSDGRIDLRRDSSGAGDRTGSCRCHARAQPPRCHQGGRQGRVPR